MNSKFIIFFFILGLSSCGVKGPPLPPVGSKIHSIIEEHSEDVKTTDPSKAQKDP